MNANTKVNRWPLELATYNISIEWISGAKNKAADCLSCLVQLSQTTPAPITYYLLQTQVDQHLTPKVKHTNAFPWILPQYYLMLCQKSQNTISYTKIPDSGQIRSSLTDAEDRSFLEKNI